MVSVLRTRLALFMSSTIFPEVSRDDLAAFTLFIGGARSPELFEDDHGLLNKVVIGEFQEIMGINENPVFIREKMWPRAIPQYNIGYVEHERYFEKFERDHPGIFLSGNCRGGISVGDCIKNSEVMCRKIESFLSKIVDNRSNH